MLLQHVEFQVNYKLVRLNYTTNPNQWNKIVQHNNKAMKQLDHKVDKTEIKNKNKKYPESIM